MTDIEKEMRTARTLAYATTVALLLALVLIGINLATGDLVCALAFSIAALTSYFAGVSSMLRLKALAREQFFMKNLDELLTPVGWVDPDRDFQFVPVNETAHVGADWLIVLEAPPE